MQTLRSENAVITPPAGESSALAPGNRPGGEGASVQLAEQDNGPGASSELGLRGEAPRALRIGGVPTARSASAVMPLQARSDLAAVTETIEQLRTTIEASLAPERVVRDVREMKDSVQYLEAFLSVSLVPHLDKLLGEKLTTVQSVEARRKRTSAWLTASCAVNLALLAALIFEVETQVLRPVGMQMLEISGSAIAGAAQIAHGAFAALAATIASWLAPGQ